MAATDTKPVSEEDAKRADELKQQANDLFKEKHFAKALDLYSQAIDLNPSNAVYYGNRAFAHLKLENYGAAVSDASAAIKIDNTYVKAYYRRADGHMRMLQFKEALKDFKLAARVAPGDPDLRRKLNECEKEVKRMRFEEALRSEHADDKPASEQVVVGDIVVPDSYQGPRMEADGQGGYRISREFVLAMVEAFRAQKTVHPRFAYEIIFECLRQFKELPSLVDVAVAPGTDITVCGDTHGQFYDLLNIFALNGWPSAENPYLFNGDFVDRGSFSAEVILTLMAFRALDPTCMHLVRGNHETRAMNRIYGFVGEVSAKYSKIMSDVFNDAFDWMPLAYVLDKKVFITHGGLFGRDDVTLDDIRAIDRVREPPEGSIMCECLWSDPQPQNGRSESKRGTGTQFGPDVTKAFLERNGLKLLVRSHEVKEDGYEIAHDGYCVTVFSAPNYCDQMGNKGAFIRFTAPDMVPKFTQFDAVPHPAVRPMQYANPLLSLMGGA
ncbi:unnamed protein product [Pedinophyceae sp. YPF-701]|nr:unnamed protein product [Pedinophyceae sp. YPF-701]